MSPGSNSKRGFLRPSHSGRISIFILLVITLLVFLLTYNLYTSSSVRSDLEDEIAALSGKKTDCEESVLGLRTRLEDAAKQCKGKLSDSHLKIEKLTTDNERLTDKSMQADSRIEKLTAELDKMRGELARSSDRIAAMQTYNVSLFERVKRVEAKNKLLEIQNDVLATNLTTLLASMNDTQSKDLAFKGSGLETLKQVQALFPKGIVTDSKDNLSVDRINDSKRIKIANDLLIATLSPDLTSQSYNRGIQDDEAAKDMISEKNVHNLHVDSSPDNKVSSTQHALDSKLAENVLQSPDLMNKNRPSAKNEESLLSNNQNEKQQQMGLRKKSNFGNVLLSGQPASFKLNELLTRNEKKHKIDAAKELRSGEILDDANNSKDTLNNDLKHLNGDANEIQQPGSLKRKQNSNMAKELNEDNDNDF